jgi:hypothetical protein
MVGQAPPYQNFNPKTADKSHQYISYINRLGRGKSIKKFFERKDKNPQDKPGG